MGANTIKNMVNLDLSELSDVVSHDNAAVETETATEQQSAEATEQQDVAKQPVAKAKPRSNKYIAARSLVDRTLEYTAADAVNLVKKTSYSSFAGTITAHLNLRRDINPVEVTFPHSTGKDLRVAIADETLLDKLAAEEIDFDILLAEPKMMPKLAKYARFLGPRGLMPNPKSGTVTSNPETKKKELLSGKMVIRPEKKAPLMHVRLGTTTQPEVELVANLEALLSAVKTNNVDKVTLSPTMGPGVRVKVERK